MAARERGAADVTAVCAHTPCPDGYVERSEWADEMIKTHRQVKCPVCGRLAIWKPSRRPIKQDIARRATELEGDVADEYAAWCEEQHREYLATSEYMAMQAEIEMVAGVSSTEVR